MIKFELNSDGVKELLQSKGVASAINGYARTIQSRAGSGYGVKSASVKGDRQSALVYTATKEAMEDNYENNTLLRARG